jgi:coenzyme F420-0:L-glutamate ligase/coenzyme F420-1:gamma-L-glutamate ligase
MLSAVALDGIPEVAVGDDLGALIVGALGEARVGLGGEPGVLGREPLRQTDVLVIAHKVVSKSEGRIRRLAEVEPGSRARELARRVGKDPRHVQVILDESAEVLRARNGVLICVTHHGFVCANAGVDASNVGGAGRPVTREDRPVAANDALTPGEGRPAAREDTPAPGGDAVVLLPIDPDASARRIRARIGELTGARPGVVITDSFGRAWRIGQCDVAIGCAGIEPVEDWRGRADAYGRKLEATVIAVADQLAATADLIRGKNLSQPIILIKGAARHTTAEDGPGARSLLRASEHDLFR